MSKETQHCANVVNNLTALIKDIAEKEVEKAFKVKQLPGGRASDSKPNSSSESTELNSQDVTVIRSEIKKFIETNDFIDGRLRNVVEGILISDYLKLVSIDDDYDYNQLKSNIDTYLDDKSKSEKSAVRPDLKSVYEEFLEKLITLSAAIQSKIQADAGVKRSGGGRMIMRRTSKRSGKKKKGKRTLKYLK